MTPIHPIVEALVYRLDDGLREMFEERAGILQFEAGNPREQAEPLALLDVVRMHPLAFAGVVCLRVIFAGAPVYVIAAHEARATATLTALGGTGAARVDLAVAIPGRDRPPNDAGFSSQKLRKLAYLKQEGLRPSPLTNQGEINE